ERRARPPRQRDAPGRAQLGREVDGALQACDGEDFTQRICHAAWLVRSDMRTRFLAIVSRSGAIDYACTRRERLFHGCSLETRARGGGRGRSVVLRFSSGCSRAQWRPRWPSPVPSSTAVRRAPTLLRSRSTFTPPTLKVSG